MATFYGALNPTQAQTDAAVVGDIFVRTSGVNPQFRRNSTAWTGTWTASWDAIVPPDTRADVVPRAGSVNQRLAKNSGTAWDMAWVNAAAGIVGPPNANAALAGRFEQTTPAPMWEIEHQLGARWVDVTVISPGHTDPAGAQSLIIPDVEYTSDMICRLHFRKPMLGTAIVRR